MRITKYGHCALLIEEAGVRILTDPGSYSLRQTEARGLNAIVITHEHGDHLHLDSLKTLIRENPGVRVITNSGAGAILSGERIVFELMEDGASGNVSGLKLEALGNEHAEIYQDFGRAQNTGFFFGGRFFYPGDAFYLPNKSVEVLALPVAGSWLKISEAMEYALAVKPLRVIPVHDGILKNANLAHTVPAAFLPAHEIAFCPIEEMGALEF
ncbi:MAG: MBL fold metallo-hydrolase [Candidatus Liptonbacteria bacterium]